MINTFTAVGRLTKDPELRKTSSGVSVLQFTIACDRDRKGKDGKYPADFINCRAWRQSAEFLANYAKKGNLVAISGRIETDTYQDKATGKNVHTWCVNCDNVQILSSKSNSSNDFYPENAPVPTDDDEPDFY